MISYQERFDDVWALVRGEYGVTDQQLVEILLAARIEMPGYVVPWIILETEYLSLDTRPGWFNFGDTADTAISMSLATLRVQRPRAANPIILKLMAERNLPKLFIEPNFQVPVTVNYKCRLYPYLIRSSVRLRSPYPRRLPPPDHAAPKLAEATRRLLDNRFRDEFKPGPVPKSLPYYAELLERVLPDHTIDWDVLIKGLISIAHRRAYLFNRSTDESDWRTVARVMRDMIPVWTADVLSKFAVNGRWHSLKGKYTEKLIAAEVRRLKGRGVTYSYKNEWRLHDKDGQGKDIMGLIPGDLAMI